MLAHTIFVICTSCSDMPAVGFMLAIMPLGFCGKAILSCDAWDRRTAARRERVKRRGRKVDG